MTANNNKPSILNGDKVPTEWSKTELTVDGASTIGVSAKGYIGFWYNGRWCGGFPLEVAQALRDNPAIFEAAIKMSEDIKAKKEADEVKTNVNRKVSTRAAKLIEELKALQDAGVDLSTLVPKKQA